MSLKNRDPNRFFVYKFGIIAFVVVCAVSVYFANLQTSQNKQKQAQENQKIAIQKEAERKKEQEINKPRQTQPIKEHSRPQIKTSSYDDKMQSAIWDLPSAKLMNLDNFQSMKPNDEGYLFGVKVNSSKSKVIQTDFEGKILWEKNVDLNDLSSGIDSANDYIIARNIIFDKNSRRIIKRAENDKAFMHVVSFGQNFVASDTYNNVYFLDKNLNEIWRKSIKTDLKSNYTTYHYNADGTLKETVKHSETMAVCEQILKTKDNKILLSVRGEGLFKYDLNGNLVKEQRLENWAYVKITQSDDGSLFALKTHKENGFFYDGVANITKFDSDLNEIYSKDLRRENGDNYVHYFLSAYKSGLLLTVSKTDKTSKQTWVKFFEFDKNGNKIDENMISDYPESTTLYFAQSLRDGGVLVGGGTLYDQYSPPVLIKGELVKLSNNLITNGILIKISPDIPLGDQKIKEFDEEFLRK